MTPKEKLEVIRQFIPGTYSDLATKIDCHVQTLHNLKAGKEVSGEISDRLDGLYKKALTIQAVADA